MWAQPAAWADEIIQCWLSDLLAQYVYQSINCVDCFSGQWTENVLHTSWLNSQMQIPIGPECTPLLQLTDTLISFSAKRTGEKVKAELEMQLREVARREGTTYKAKFGISGLWTVTKAMANDGSERQKAEDLVLAQAIKSQLLVWRPGKLGLEPIESQSWSKVYPRWPYQSGLSSSWVEHRSRHLEDQPQPPVPPVPDWDKLNIQLLDEQCMPALPDIGDMVLEDISGAVISSLSAHHQDMLRSPQERWAMLELPSILKSQKATESARKKKTSGVRSCRRRGRQASLKFGK